MPLPLPSAPKGQDFLRKAMFLARARGDAQAAYVMAENAFGAESRVAMGLKAIVTGAAPNTWGAQLLRQSGDEYFAYVRPQLIIGRLGARQVPPRTRLITAMSGAAAYWVGSGGGKPVTALSFEADTLELLKVASLWVTSEELARMSSDAAEQFTRTEMTRGLVEVIDTSFIDPSNAGIPDVAPAAITFGAPSFVSTNNPIDDLITMFDAFTGDIESAALVMHPATALALALARDASGNFQFVDIGPRGGSVLGLPVIVSKSVPSDSTGRMIALIDASGVTVGEGETVLKTSREASVEMVDNTTQSAGDGTATTLISLWQCGSVGVLVERDMNWRARDNSVVTTTGVNYSPGSIT